LNKLHASIFRIIQEYVGKRFSKMLLPTYQTTQDHTSEMKLHRKASSKYKTLNKKLDNLSQSQTPTPLDTPTFYPRVVNNTNILFPTSRCTCYRKGLSTRYTPTEATGYRTWR
jgi:hypothetical protein